MKHFPGAIAALLLLVMGILAGGAAFRESITVDEVAHIGAGVSYLQKLDMRMNLEHPPLAKVFAAIPLVFSEVRADYSHPSWSISNHGVGGMLGEWSRGHFLALRWNNPGSTVLWARVPMLLLTLVLGVWYTVLRPNWVVRGVGCSVWWPMWRAPSRRAAIVFGLLLGVAFLTKFSSGLLLFCFLAFRLILRVAPLPGMPKDREELRSWRRLRGRYMWQGMFLAALSIYVVYFILSWREPTDWLDVLGTGTAALILRLPVSRMTISIRHFTIPILLMIFLLAPVPHIIDRLRVSGWRAARVASAAYVVLSIISVVTVIRPYPYYFPFLNSLSFGRPGYEWRRRRRLGLCDQLLCRMEV
jgi:hypothetical protein